MRNSTIWITGASSGIGRALAIALSKNDNRLILSGRDTDGLERTRSDCAVQELVHIKYLDLEQYHTLPELVENTVAEFGPIDVLINNAGISQRALAVDTAIQTDERIMHINFFGTVSLTKAILPHFIARKSGHIVTVTSIVGKIGTPLRSTYAASKHALHGFFDSLRAEIHDSGIYVTLCCPGFVRTQISMNALTGDGSPQNKMDQATANGLNPEQAAIKIINAINRKKEEVCIAGAKEKSAIWVKRLFPSLLSKMIRKVPVT